MPALEAPPDRRSGDRRGVGERRRGAEHRRLAIEIGPSTLRVAVTSTDAKDGARVLVTRSLSWRDTRSTPLRDDALERLTAALKQVVGDLRCAGSAATVALSGALCVTRAVSGATAEVERELKQLSERSAQYLALGAGPKCYASSRRALDARHATALLSVANEKTVETVVGAAAAAGIELKGVESAMVALSRAHAVLHPADEDAVLLVHLSDGGVDLGVSVQGRVVLEHRPGGRAGERDIPKILAQHHGRLERYCRRQPGCQGTGLKRVYIAGPVEQVAAAVAGCAALGGLVVAPLDTAGALQTWDLRQGELGPEFGPVLGLATLHGEGPGVPLGPNLLERWILESRRHVRPILMRSSAPLVVVMVVAAALWGYNQRLASGNRALQAEVDALAVTGARFSQLRLDEAASQTKARELTALAAQVPRNLAELHVAAVAGSLPNDVWLERLAILGRDAVVTGASYTEGGVYDFVQHLERAPDFEKVALEGTGVGQSPEGPTTNFELKFSVLPAETQGAMP